jgi:hypothetical protein
LAATHVPAELAELALSLGIDKKRLEATIARHGERGTLIRLKKQRASRNRRAERDAESQWHKDQADAARDRHELTQAQEMALRRAQRASTPPGQRIGAVLAGMRLLQEQTRASGYEPRVAGSEADGPTELWDKPLFDTWLSRFERLVRLAEHDLDVAAGRILARKDSGEERTKRILREYHGEPAEIVALCEGVTVQHVHSIRRKPDDAA